MSNNTLGKLPPRYSFILNSYKDTRLSKCPLCRKLTHMSQAFFEYEMNVPGLADLGLWAKATMHRFRDMSGNSASASGGGAYAPQEFGGPASVNSHSYALGLKRIEPWPGSSIVEKSTGDIEKFTVRSWVHGNQWIRLMGRFKRAGRTKRAFKSFY